MDERRRDASEIGPGWPPALAALSLGAALVHAAATTRHAGNPTLVALLAAVAIVQGAWSLAVLRTTDARVLWIAIAVNGAVLVAYVVSRTAGLPGIEGAERVGARDLLCVTLEVGLVASCVYLLGPSSFLASYRDLPLRSALGCTVVVVALAAVALHAKDPGARSASTARASTGAAAAAAAAHDHAAHLAAGHDPGADPHAGHEIVPTTGPKVDPQALITATRAAALRWADARTALADGYRWVGDWPFEHFVNWTLVAGPGTLDAQHPESLVYVGDRAGRLHLVSVMYIAPWGTSFASVPDVGGAPWHTHPDLCWDGSMDEIGAIPAGGTACTSGTNIVLPPMLHVWVTANPCGPFAELEDSAAVALHVIDGTPIPASLPASDCQHAHAAHAGHTDQQLAAAG